MKYEMLLKMIHETDNRIQALSVASENILLYSSESLPEIVEVSTKLKETNKLFREMEVALDKFIYSMKNKTTPLKKRPEISLRNLMEDVK